MPFAVRPRLPDRVAAAGGTAARLGAEFLRELPVRRTRGAVNIGTVAGDRLVEDAATCRGRALPMPRDSSNLLSSTTAEAGVKGLARGLGPIARAGVVNGGRR